MAEMKLTQEQIEALLSAPIDQPLVKLLRSEGCSDEEIAQMILES